MLILSRKTGETLILGDNVKIKVLSIHGNSVKLGIIAPRELKIYREELYQAIANENKESIAMPVNEFKGLLAKMKELKDKKDRND